MSRKSYHKTTQKTISYTSRTGNSSTQSYSPEEIKGYFQLRIPDARLNGQAQVSLLCPFHEGEGSRPSFSLNWKKGVWTCHGLCHESGGIIDFERKYSDCDYRTAIKNINQIVGKKQKASRGEVEATYDYTDAEDQFVFQVVRKRQLNGDKTFVQRHRDATGNWVYNLNNITPILYRLPDVIVARDVCIVEGELCVERLRAAFAQAGVRDVAVTTNPCGAGKWRDEYARYLAGRRVVILPDNDETGRRHGQQVAASALKMTKALKVVELPKLPNKGDVVDFLDSGGTVAQLQQLFDSTPTWNAPGAMPVESGAAILDDIKKFVHRFIVMTDSQSTAVALWCAHTYAPEAAIWTPYLNVSSAQKRSGKSRALELVGFLVHAPWHTSGATAASLFRKIDADRPTLLLDELDAVFRGDKETAQAIRAILNAGAHHKGMVSRVVGQGSEMTVKDYRAYCPKALATIGSLPDTVDDRGLPIRLKRKKPEEKVEPLRERHMGAEAELLRKRLAAWVDRHREELANARPAELEGLNDRQQDGAECLLAIAQIAGGAWPEKSSTALNEIYTGETTEEQPLAIQLLADVREVFRAEDDPRVMASAVLVSALVEKEGSPWGECNHGKAITANALARMLKPFAIRPHGTIRIGERTSQGYLRDQFEDAWSRYLPQNTDSSAPQPSHPSQCSKNAGLSSSSKPSQTTDVMDAESEETPVKMRAVMNVMDANQGVKLKGRRNGKMPAIAEGRRKAKLTPQEWLRTRLLARPLQIDDIMYTAEKYDWDWDEMEKARVQLRIVEKRRGPDQIVHWSLPMNARGDARGSEGNEYP